MRSERRNWKQNKGKRMIDWIHEGCKHWGWQMRIFYLGGDGWISRSILGKMMEEGLLGASASRLIQFFPECMDAEALKYNNAIKTLGERDRETLVICYVVIGKLKVKAHRLGIDESTLFQRRNTAQAHLSQAIHRVATEKKAPKTRQSNYNEVALCVP